jgi:hypothetical protein
MFAPTKHTTKNLCAFFKDNGLKKVYNINELLYQFLKLSFSSFTDIISRPDPLRSQNIFLAGKLYRLKRESRRRRRGRRWRRRKRSFLDLRSCQSQK